ncbi:hypothetical protein, partial [Escherichia coli]|uniref:hypothetical protein n=1 Tax=Escherichia coli TaxID=562 RepID=UPI003A599384
VNNTAFTNNTAEGYGGAIFIHILSAPLFFFFFFFFSYNPNRGVFFFLKNIPAGY